jgi:hypothetical protein
MSVLDKSNHFRVFSDSIDYVRHEFINLGPRFEYVENSDAGQPLKDLFRMGGSTSMIMSNSSFSWWAAFLVQNFSGGPVIAPRPWFRSGESAADLLLNDWITLDGR